MLAVPTAFSVQPASGAGDEDVSELCVRESGGAHVTHALRQPGVVEWPLEWNACCRGHATKLRDEPAPFEGAWLEQVMLEQDGRHPGGSRESRFQSGRCRLVEVPEP